MGSPKQKQKPAKQKAQNSSDSGEESDQESESPVPPRVMMARRPSIIAFSLRTQHYGSFYLRMGAVGKKIYMTELSFLTPVEKSLHLGDYKNIFYSIRNWQYDLQWFRIWTIFRT